uniref:Histidinol-phosphate aminotransferase n=1 Tax=Caldiarchaeum subterraneum TaxID=311458 RepID=A0A7C5U7Q8_CALS0
MLPVRPFLNTFEAYSWEPSTAEIAKQYGLNPNEIVRMDLNTSPFQPTAWLKKLSSKLSSTQVQLYPDTSYREFRENVSAYTGRSMDEILVGNGGDECLEIIAQTFLEKGRKAVMSSPSYSYFRVCSEIMGAEVVRIPRKHDFSDDVESILEAVDSSTGVIFLCSPNNPTGNVTPINVVKKIVSQVKCSVVVDEAYFEYCGQTCTSLIDSYPNLIVVRTLSKAFSLAGARVGYALAAEETVKHLNKVRPPNSLSVISLELANTALKNIAQVRKWAQKVVEERNRLARQISSLDGVKVINTEANFLLLIFDSNQADKVYYELMKRGFVVRNLSSVIAGGLRVTVSTPRNNQRFLKALEEKALGGL